MKKKPKPHATETDPEDNQATFEKIPQETKELMLLKNLEEKTIGPEQLVITREIEDTEDGSQP